MSQILEGNYFGAFTCHACIRTRANTGKYSWGIIYVLVSCQGVCNSEGREWGVGSAVVGSAFGAPQIFAPNCSESLQNKGFRAIGANIGAPQKRRFNDHGSNAPFSSEYNFGRNGSVVVVECTRRGFVVKRWRLSLDFVLGVGGLCPSSTWSVLICCVLSAPRVRDIRRTHRVAAELSEFSLSEQHSRNSIPPVS